jgi:hypothetical protein
MASSASGRYMFLRLLRFSGAADLRDQQPTRREAPPEVTYRPGSRRQGRLRGQLPACAPAFCAAESGFAHKTIRVPFTSTRPA